MTAEDRYIIDLSDLRAIRFECQCGASVTLKLQDWMKSPRACPACDVPWLLGEGTEPFMTLQKLQQGLNGIARLLKKQDAMRFGVRLELDRPKEL